MISISASPPSAKRKTSEETRCFDDVGSMGISKIKVCPGSISGISHVVFLTGYTISQTKPLSFSADRFLTVMRTPSKSFQRLFPSANCEDDIRKRMFSSSICPTVGEETIFTSSYIREGSISIAFSALSSEKDNVRVNSSVFGIEISREYVFSAVFSAFAPFISTSASVSA